MQSFNGDRSTRVLEPVVRPHEEMSTSALIDEMFEDVLQAADREEEDGGNDSSVSESRQKADMETAEPEPKLKSPSLSPGGEEEACEGAQKEGENSNEGEEVVGEREESAECNEDDFLSFPPSCILSPLSKSVEAVVTPMVRKFMVLPREF